MKKIAVIHDLSGLGKCSLTAAIPVISAMGVQACPLPTAILSNQTGYGSYFWDDYTDRMELIMDEWKKTGFRCQTGGSDPEICRYVLYRGNTYPG